MEITEDKVVGLVKDVAVETTENDLTEAFSDEHLEYVFDVTAEGLASLFSGVAEEDVEQFFAEFFNHYSLHTIYKTEAGYYLITLL